MNEPVEELIGERAIAGHVGKHSPEIGQGVAAGNGPFDRRCGASEFLPQPPHVIVQRHLVVRARAQRQVEAQTDDAAPVVVGDEVVVDIGRVDPHGRVHELGEPAYLLGASIFPRGTSNHEIERVTCAAGKFVDAGEAGALHRERSVVVRESFGEP